MSLRRAAVIFSLSNLCVHAILGESNQIPSSHYTWYVLSDVLTTSVCYLYVCIYLLMHDRSDGGYYYSYMCMRLSSEVEYEYGTLVDVWYSGIIFFGRCSVLKCSAGVYVLLMYFLTLCSADLSNLWQKGGVKFGMFWLRFD